ncbi:MAG: hypothetical protein ABI673_06505 [Novosphingobium sp.]
MHSTFISTSRLLAPAFATLRRVLVGGTSQMAIAPGVLSDHELKQIVADLIG